MAVVTMYSPEGNPEVINTLDVDKKLQEGYKSQETWLAEQKVIAEQEYQARLTSADTVEERFQMLRAARDGKLRAYDVTVAQLEREQRLAATTEMKTAIANKLKAVDEYARALCDLPAQPGAPWDGGGKLTPWPEMPEL